MNTSKATIVVSIIIGKILSIIGYFFGSFSLALVLIGLSELAVEGTIFCFIILVFSILAIIKGAKIKRRIKRFRRYISLISIEHMTSIGKIANATSQSISFVKEDLQIMIDKRYFVNAHIDMKTSEIVIGNFQNNPFNASQSIQKDMTVETEIVNCSGCGAANVKQKNMVTQCEYCGSFIK